MLNRVQTLSRVGILNRVQTLNRVGTLSGSMVHHVCPDAAGEQLSRSRVVKHRIG